MVNKLRTLKLNKKKMEKKELTTQEIKFNETFADRWSELKDQLIHQMGFVLSEGKKAIKNIISAKMKAPKRIKQEHIMQASLYFEYEGLSVVIHTGITNDKIYRQCWRMGNDYQRSRSFVGEEFQA